MPTYVAVDLETTGTDPNEDTIIEVGAVRFGLEGPAETFHRLVHPRRPIPYRIQLLTGITQDQVESAPPFASLAAELEAFLGGAPVVGQNVAFDLAFLDRQGIRPPQAFDTFELASLLLPGAGEYSLRALAQHLGVEFPVQHRALPDAEAARQVFLALRRRLRELPLPLLWEALRVSQGVDWPLRRLLEEVAEERLGEEGEGGGGLGAVAPGGEPAAAGPAPPPLVPRERRLPVDPAEAVAVIRRGALRPDVLPGFEERPQQLEMAAAVAEAFSHGGQLLVEAGTGIGKSLAYLAPAALHALRNGARVVVSTDTISLQEQLVGKDIPALRALLEGEELRAAQLKGRRNYLCLLRWGLARHGGAASVPEARLLVRLLLWAGQTETGDRAELNLGPEEQPLWDRLSAQNENCLARPCPYVTDGRCFLLRARRRAEAAHLLVVNHALLLSDAATGGGHVLPPYEHLILDEAHNLEEEATQQFGFQATRRHLEELLEGVAPPSPGRRGAPALTAGGSSLVAALRGALRASPLALAPAAPLPTEGLAEELQAAAERARGHLPALFGRLEEAVEQLAPEENGYERRLLITRGVRAQPLWSQVELTWENLRLALERLKAVLARLLTALADWGDPALAGGLQARAEGALQSLLQLQTGVGDLLGREDPERIAWLASGRRGEVTVAGAPLRVDDLLRQRLFGRLETAILTSATLTAQGSFAYVRERLGLEEPQELLLGSPFDYRKAALLLVPADLPDPAEPGYPRAVEEALVELCRASRGRALALFTSHAAVRAARRGVAAVLEREGILVQAQGIDGSPKQLLAALRGNPQTVVLGTASLWEGVDVAGEALSLLVIARLPFAVPTDPIFAARSQLFEEPFLQYALPQAVLRFKQGFGRLIRSRHDRGVAVVLDSRIASRGYGRAFVDSLPPCTVRQLRLREMAAAVASWLAGGEG